MSRLSYRSVVWTTFIAIAFLSLAVGAGAVQGDKKIRLLDDCDPATFNAALQDPNACVGNGHTTFQEFINELIASQDAHQWRFQPSQIHINVGRPTFVENRGGEEHTFTRVATFGGGFVDILNTLSGNPVKAPECANPGVLDFIEAGETREGPTAGTGDLPVGITRFQCCIHPWMRTVIEVDAPPGLAAPASPTKGNSAAHDHH